MANITINRLNRAIEQADMDAVMAAFATIESTLSSLIGLTTEERKILPKINVDNKIFTEDAINAAVNNPDYLPGYLKPEDMQTDITLFEQLDQLMGVSNRINEKLSDTRMLAGSEAFVSALTAYRAFETSANAGMPGADQIYQQLRERFLHGGGTPPPEPEP